MEYWIALTEPPLKSRLTFLLSLKLLSLTLLLDGCAAAPAAAGYFTSGGVTLYKSAKESGPKAEFVLIKLEVNHTIYQASNESLTPTK
jgi:hypothetical protein